MTQSIFDADATVAMGRSNGSPRAGYGFEVDGIRYDHDQPSITGAQLRFLVGLYPDQALVQVLDDGLRRSVSAAQPVDLSSGARFKRRPRFKRG